MSNTVLIACNYIPLTMVLGSLSWSASWVMLSFLLAKLHLISQRLSTDFPFVKIFLITNSIHLGARSLGELFSSVELLSAQAVGAGLRRI